LRNQELHVKYADQPEKCVVSFGWRGKNPCLLTRVFVCRFMESEYELHAETLKLLV
jgi:hypothetical protein